MYLLIVGLYPALAKGGSRQSPAACAHRWSQERLITDFLVNDSFRPLDLKISQFCAETSGKKKTGDFDADSARRIGTLDDFPGVNRDKVMQFPPAPLAF
jgi:hypothetical protein